MKKRREGEKYLNNENEGKQAMEEKQLAPELLIHDAICFKVKLGRHIVDRLVDRGLRKALY